MGLVEPPKGGFVEQWLKNKDECSLPQNASRNSFPSKLGHRIATRQHISSLLHYSLVAIGIISLFQLSASTF